MTTMPDFIQSNALLVQIGFTTSSPVFVNPTINYVDSPTIICLTDLGQFDEMTAIFSNVNADFGIQLSTGPNLVGRTDLGVGPAQTITVIAPLVLDAQQLYIDQQTLLAPINARVDALSARVDTLQAQANATDAALAAQAADVAVLQATVAAQAITIAGQAATIAAQAVTITWIGRQISIGRGTDGKTTGSPTYMPPRINGWAGFNILGIATSSPVINIPVMTHS
jgi:hypothetical protein